MRWQKRARIAAASVGLATAIGVYAVMEERAQPAPAAVVDRVDPKALIESRGNILQQVRGTRQDYVIEAAQQLTYQGGATKLVDIKVTVKNRAGRDYVITAREAQAGEGEQELRLTGTVKLEASDGFQIATEEAFFSEQDGTVRAPEAFTFSRGRMSGQGVGMSYDRNNDVITIREQASVAFDGDGDEAMAFDAGSAVFTRPEHRLELLGEVHVLRGRQAIDAVEATARLADDDSRVTLLQLRGNAIVSGSGQGLEAMSAQAMDLHYAEDGRSLERLELTGNGRVEMRNGTASRTVLGQQLDIHLAADGSPTNIAGSDGVSLDLGGGGNSPARVIAGRSLNATGASGRGLTGARFEGDVEYREGTGAAARVARSEQLEVQMADTAIRSATFSGNVRFQEGALRATAGRALYDPPRDSLRLAPGGAPAASTLVNDRVTVEAATIDLTIAGGRIAAQGDVKTTLRPAAPAGRRGGAAPDSGRLPGLLQEGRAVNVNAGSFTYEGGNGRIVYDGDAALFQGETAIRARQITLDQARGDLVAAGEARSTMALDSATSVGRAERIAYAEASRTITYTKGTPPATTAQLSGPHGELRAGEIQIVLSAEGDDAERLEAFGRVALALQGRQATGGRLTYFADDERYVMTSTGTDPVTVVDQCRQISGRTLIFFKGTDRIIVDGNEEIRTQTTTGNTCAQPPPRPR